jgi:hypothetical protein
MKPSKEQIKEVILAGVKESRTQDTIRQELDAIGYSVSRERVRQLIKKYGFWDEWKQVREDKASSDMLEQIRHRAGTFPLEQKYSLKWQRARYNFSRKKAHCTQSGKEFTLEFEDLIWPDVCPVLGIPLDYTVHGRSENAPTFDQIEAGKGYVKNNVMIISWRANRIKNNGTADEHRLIAEFMELDFEEVFNGIEARLLKKRQDEEMNKVQIIEDAFTNRFNHLEEFDDC